MSDPYTGGCACGAIRYEIPGDPVFMNHCQCLDCQRKSGTGHGSYLTLPTEGMKLAGHPAYWDIVADSGNVRTRAFCPTCGSPLSIRFSAMPNLVAVHAGSLDDPSRFKPEAITYHKRALAWDTLDPALKAYDAMPE